MSYCCVNGCDKISTNRNPNDNTAFYPFPKDVNLKEKWLEAIKRPYWKPPKFARVCSNHFSFEQMSHIGKTIRIKNDAVPILELPGQSNFEASQVEVCRFCLASDVKLFSLLSGPHKLYLESLVGYSENNYVDGLPQYVCYECAAHLKRCYDFIEKSMIAQTTLLDIFAVRGKVTMRHINNVNRRSLNLTSPLTQNVLDTSFPFECNNWSSDTAVLTKKKTTPNTVKKIMIEGIKPRIAKKTVGTQTDNEKIKEIKIDDVKETQDEYLEETQDEYLEETQDEYLVETQDKYLEETQDKITEMEIDVSEELNETDVKYNDKAEFLKDESNECKDGANLDQEIVDSWSSGKFRVKNKSAEQIKDENDLKKKFHIYELTLEQQIEEWNKTHVKADGLKNQCEICFSVLENETIYSSHVKRHNIKHGKWRCAVCQLRFARKSSALTHNRLKHLKRYRCKKCRKVFSCIGKAKKHMHTNKCWDLYRCKLCPFETDLANELAVHRRSHRVGPHVCLNCGSEFPSHYRLLQHVAQEHQQTGVKQLDPHLCPTCGDTFYSAKGLAQHTAIMHLEPKDGPHECQSCGDIFKTAKGLALHDTIMHLKPEDQVQEKIEPTPTEQDGDKQTYRCEQCGLDFNSEGARRVHVLISKQHKKRTDSSDTTQVTSQKSSCNECGIEFNLLTELVDHVKREHMTANSPISVAPQNKPRPWSQKYGQYPKKCEYCSLVLRSRLEHYWHLKCRHPGLESSYKPIHRAMCAQCGKSFTNKWLLKKHELRHGEPTLPCPVCSRLFHHERALAAHSKTHKPERPYRCPHCPLAFKQKNNLRRHFRVHSGATPYECPICEKKMKYSESLKLHVRTVHLKQPHPPRKKRTRQKKTKYTD